MERVLRKDKLLETAEQVAQLITEKFPGSGLSQVAAEVVQVTREAVVRAEHIRRPNFLLRGGLVLLALTAIGVVWWEVRDTSSGGISIGRVLNVLDVTKGGAAWLGALALFLVTLEIRWKRRRALQAVHELRAMAHIIDMHQLAKDPERLGSAAAPLLRSGRPMNSADVCCYLHFCTELLALVSKVGHLYVQDFADSPTLAAVDQFENLATGLSEKIWQKVMILERLPTAAKGQAADGKAVSEIPARPPAAAPA
jgi:hypothetical protein